MNPIPYRGIPEIWPLVKRSGAHVDLRELEDEIARGRSVAVRSRGDREAVAILSRWREGLPIGWIKAFWGGRRPAEFAADLGKYLLERGFEAALSPFLRRGTEECFARAGYREKEAISVMSLGFLRGADDRGIAAIRPLGADEEGSVLAVDRASFDEFWRLEAADFREFLRGRRSFVAVLNGSIVGYNIVGANAGRGVLARLAVAPAARGLGIGRQLVCRAINWFIDEGAWAAVLTTQAKNEPARSLYEGLGFRKVDELALLLFGDERACSR